MWKFGLQLYNRPNKYITNSVLTLIYKYKLHQHLIFLNIRMPGSVICEHDFHY